MELYHYMVPSEEDGPVCRRITNLPSKKQRLAVIESQITKRVVHIKGSSFRVLAQDTGSWTFPLLIERANKMGVQYRADSYDIDVIKELSDEKLIELMVGVNFAWATASNFITITFKGYDGFDLSPLGLKVDNHKKLSKRLTEIIRCSGFYYYGDITYQEFTTPEGHEDIFYDGGNAITRSFATKMGLGEDVTRINLRLLTPDGLIKGDAQVVPDHKLDVDVLYHTENLKPELSTTDWTMATAIDHPPHHELRHDDQTRSNFSFFIPEETVVEDLKNLVRNWKKSANWSKTRISSKAVFPTLPSTSRMVA